MLMLLPLFLGFPSACSSISSESAGAAPVDVGLANLLINLTAITVVLWWCLYANTCCGTANATRI